MESESLVVDGKEMFLAQAGAGRRMVVALHGYGNDHRLFRFLAKDLPADVRLVVPDLPFFGKSQMEDAALPLDGPWLRACMEALRSRFPDAEAVELIGFSLGAKFALGLFQHSPFPLRKLTLISPDGLRIHPLYRFCIYHPVGRRLFRGTLRWPGGFLFVLRMLYNLRIADAFKYRFVKGQFAKEERRQQLERVWFGYAGIRPDLDLIARRAADWQTLWHVIWGEKDTVLPVQLGEEFREKVPGVEMHLVPGGHRLLQPPTPEVLTLLTKIIQES